MKFKTFVDRYSRERTNTSQSPKKKSPSPNMNKTNGFNKKSP